MGRHSTGPGAGATPSGPSFGGSAPVTDPILLDGHVSPSTGSTARLVAPSPAPAAERAPRPAPAGVPVPAQPTAPRSAAPRPAAAPRPTSRPAAPAAPRPPAAMQAPWAPRPVVRQQDAPFSGPVAIPDPEPAVDDDVAAPATALPAPAASPASAPLPAAAAPAAAAAPPASSTPPAAQPGTPRSLPMLLDLPPRTAAAPSAQHVRAEHTDNLSAAAQQREEPARDPEDLHDEPIDGPAVDVGLSMRALLLSVGGGLAVAAALSVIAVLPP